MLGHDIPTALGSRWDGFDHFVGARYHKSFVDHCKTTLCLIQSIMAQAHMATDLDNVLKSMLSYAVYAILSYLCYRKLSYAILRYLMIRYAILRSLMLYYRNLT